MTIYTAAGAGQSCKTLLTNLGSGLEDQGMTVTYDEVAPTTEDDPNASGLSVLALPLAFGGMISAALLSLTMKKRYSLRVIGSLSFSVIAGFLVGAILQFGFGTFDANYWELSLILALGIGGTSMYVLGLESLIGYAGLGLGAVLTLFVSNPLSGIATGWQWLPSPWGMIGQYLPIGAAGNAARSVGFFDGAGATHSVVTLIVWVLIGLGFVGLATLKDRKAASPAAS
ncbi:MAG: ABC transporter ATP-binding protein [Corynebacterium variabile]|uniref:ABC transporter ATP-binding protein n=1 Tax=Corynebacterium variabile TaxID=1727 RepID=UPI00264A0B20|nr:ABC transporter ATP-binding protein [Corynebacterium variabile]MDN6845311.1 ABC transporter ATP-binding protein [Corynebacterium variabile]